MSHSLFSGNPSRFPFYFRYGRRFSLPYRFIAVSSFLHVNRALVVRSDQLMSRNDLLRDQEENELEIIDKDILPSQGYSSFDFPTWLSWVLGSILIVGAIPYYKKLSAIEDKLEKAAEEVLHVVEKVAEATEELTEELAEKIPVEGELKKIILELEEVAKAVDHAAELAQSLAKKVDDRVEEVDENAKEPEMSVEGHTMKAGHNTKSQRKETK